jgi:hypothetical protein
VCMYLCMYVCVCVSRIYIDVTHIHNWHYLCKGVHFPDGSAILARGHCTPHHVIGVVVYCAESVVAVCLCVCVCARESV